MHKDLGLSDLLIDIDTSSSGFEITYTTPESLNKHDAIYKAYARDQLSLINSVLSYTKSWQLKPLRQEKH